MDEFTSIKSFNRPGYTLTGLTLDWNVYDKLKDFDSFSRRLLTDVDSLRASYKKYFDERRKENSSWVNNSQNILALLGATAILLTAGASGLRLINDGTVFGVPGADKALLVATLLLYGLMAALAFFEKGTDRVNDYFRHLAVMFALRDLWTKFQFEVLKELTAMKSAPDLVTAEKAARARLVELAAAVCADFDKLTTSELSDWTKSDFAARSTLDEAAKAGLDVVYKRLEDRTAELEKAKKSEADAAKPAFVNIALSGLFDGDVEIDIDGTKIFTGAGKNIAIGQLTLGPHTIAARARKGTISVAWSKTVNIEPGLNDISVALS